MDVGAALALLGLAFGWALYRLERTASRRRDIDAARSSLHALQRGVFSSDDESGWGDLYFVHGYDDAGALERAAQDAEAILGNGFNQVFVVPAEPLLVIAASPSAGDLISDETIRCANFGLWKIGVFNQLVQAQTEWNVRHLVEINDRETPALRRNALAQAAVSLSHLLHLQGIGQPNIEGGWYYRLKSAVQRDLDRLTRERSQVWTRREWWHVLGDALALMVVVGVIVWALLEAT